jgi:hypothetical protein
LNGDRSRHYQCTGADQTTSQMCVTEHTGMLSACVERPCAVNEEISEGAPGVAFLRHRGDMLSAWSAMRSTTIGQAGHNRSGQESHMNVRTITSFVLAVALMATTAGVYAAQQFGRDGVYAQAGKPSHKHCFDSSNHPLWPRQRLCHKGPHFVQTERRKLRRRGD